MKIIKHLLLGIWKAVSVPTCSQGLAAFFQQAVHTVMHFNRSPTCFLVSFKTRKTYNSMSSILSVSPGLHLSHTTETKGVFNIACSLK